jgi:murein DD-endopeptidase MepM/ murein hydrolase activator NlpD
MRMTARRRTVAAAVIVMISLAAHSAPARPESNACPPLPTGGVMQPSISLAERWCWSGAWRYPVGGPRDFQQPGTGSSAAYRLNRNIGGPDSGTATHQGADLSCGRGGGPVCAAATGLVLVAARQGWNSGYGRHVVIGHRLGDGTLAYTVYAHLSQGTIRVRAGQTIAAGTLLGRVGSTGRATSPHLHFEVRLVEDPAGPWQEARVVDPVAFVWARRAEEAPPDSLAACWEWAAYTGLVDSVGAGADELTHARWWRMLGVAGAHQLSELPSTSDALRDSLIAGGLLPEETREKAKSAVTWEEMARDLRHLGYANPKLPTRPLSNTKLRAICRGVLGVPSPGHEPSALRHRKDSTTALAAVLALADLAPPPPARRAAPGQPGRAPAPKSVKSKTARPDSLRSDSLKSSS